MTSVSLLWNKQHFSLRNFSNDFLLLRSEDNSSVAAIGKQIFAQHFDFVEEVIVTEREVCLQLNTHFEPQKINLLQSLPLPAVQSCSTYQLPVYFADHEDWQGVTAATSIGKEDIIAQLLMTEFTVAMFGFLPGFAYLDGLPRELHVPRKTVPAKYVEANALAIGGKYLGWYAIDSPGGWHVIGRTPITALQLPKLPPVLLNLDDRIQLCAIDKAAFIQISNQKHNLLTYNG